MCRYGRVIGIWALTAGSFLGPTREGVGLGNTRARLLEMYGDGARMEVGPDHPRGTRVRLRLPDGKATA